MPPALENLTAQANQKVLMIGPNSDQIICGVMGNVKMVKVLISYNKLDLCVKVLNRFTSLYQTVIDGYVPIVEHLLNHQS